MRIRTRLGLIVVSAIPTYCHYKVTAPYLMQHGSGAAFELGLAMWAACLIILMMAVFGD